MLAACTGLRRGELLALRWSDIDLDQAGLSVVRTLEETKGGLHFKAPKTARSRRKVTLPAAAVAALRKHKVAQAQERLSLGFGRDPDALLFATPEGAPLGPRAVSQASAHVVRRAKVPSVGFHALRHAHITMLLKAGVHPKVASERAGHASVSITLDVYSHVLPALQEAAAAKIDSWLANAIETS